MTENKLNNSYNNDNENTQHDLQEAKQNLLTLEALIKMRSKKIPQANDDGTKKDEDFDIDPIPGYGGAW